MVIDFGYGDDTWEDIFVDVGKVIRIDIESDYFDILISPKIALFVKKPAQQALDHPRFQRATRKKVH